jgi:hypothetical protein
MWSAQATGGSIDGSEIPVVILGEDGHADHVGRPEPEKKLWF